jgi:hypothetical protein
VAIARPASPRPSRSASSRSFTSARPYAMTASALAKLLQLGRKFGRVRPEGIRLDLPLTYQLLADAVGGRTRDGQPAAPTAPARWDRRARGEDVRAKAAAARSRIATSRRWGILGPVGYATSMTGREQQDCLYAPHTCPRGSGRFSICRRLGSKLRKL